MKAITCVANVIKMFVFCFCIVTDILIVLEEKNSNKFCRKSLKFKNKRFLLYTRAYMFVLKKRSFFRFLISIKVVEDQIANNKLLDFEKRNCSK
jgi:hypothetical protein